MSDTLDGILVGCTDPDCPACGVCERCEGRFQTAAKEAEERGRREADKKLLAMVKELSCDRGHAPGCSGEQLEYRCKCGWREMEPKAQALINEIEGKK